MGSRERCLSIPVAGPLPSSRSTSPMTRCRRCGPSATRRSWLTSARSPMGRTTLSRDPKLTDWAKPLRRWSEALSFAYVHVETLEEFGARPFSALPERDDLAEIRGEAHAGCMDVEEAGSFRDAEGVHGTRRGHGE